jgi:hypothetical protein
MKTPKAFNWRPPDALKEELRESAKANGRTMNAELTYAVRQYLQGWRKL